MVLQYFHHNQGINISSRSTPYPSTSNNRFQFPMVHRVDSRGSKFDFTRFSILYTRKVTPYFGKTYLLIWYAPSHTIRWNSLQVSLRFPRVETLPLLKKGWFRSHSDVINGKYILRTDGDDRESLFKIKRPLPQPPPLPLTTLHRGGFTLPKKQKKQKKKSFCDQPMITSSSFSSFLLLI